MYTYFEPSAPELNFGKFSFKKVLKKVVRPIRKAATSFLKQRGAEAGIIEPELPPAPPVAKAQESPPFLATVPDWQKYAGVAAIALIGLLVYMKVQKSK